MGQHFCKKQDSAWHCNSGAVVHAKRPIKLESLRARASHWHDVDSSAVAARFILRLPSRSRLTHKGLKHTDLACHERTFLGL